MTMNNKHYWFYVWLAFSVLCLVFTFISHPIIHNEKSTSNLVLNSQVVKKETAGDVLGSSALDPNKPENVSFIFSYTFESQSFMTLSSYNGNESLKGVLSLEGLDEDLHFDFMHGHLYINPKQDNREFSLICSIGKNEKYFEAVWNKNFSVEDYSFRIENAPIDLDLGSFFGIITCVSTFASLAVLGALAGLIVSAIVLGVIFGYHELPLFIRFPIDVLLFPIILLFGIGGKSSDPSNPRNRVHDKKGNFVGYYDYKDHVVRDGSGHIIMPGSDKQ